MLTARRTARGSACGTTVMITVANTTIPAMISNTSNCGRAITATRPVGFTMALGMEWKKPAINTLGRRRCTASQ
jgi:hypothetical protein